MHSSFKIILKSISRLKIFYQIQEIPTDQGGPDVDSIVIIEFKYSAKLLCEVK